MKSHRTQTLARTLVALGFGATVLSPSPVLSQRSTALSAAEVFKKASPAIVTISTPGGLGSGVVVDPSGVIVTNLHVVRGEQTATVTLPNGDKYDDVSIVDLDARKDIVLLKIKAFKLPFAELGDSDSVGVGDPVYAIGAPEGLQLSLSDGIVSAVRDTGSGYRAIQITAAISAGSSGGGLFDKLGRLVGVTAFRLPEGESLNFAIPVNYVRGLIATTAQFSLAELSRRFPKETTTVRAPPSRSQRTQVPEPQNTRVSVEGLSMDAVLRLFGPPSLVQNQQGTGGRVTIWYYDHTPTGTVTISFVNGRATMRVFPK